MHRSKVDARHVEVDSVAEDDGNLRWGWWVREKLVRARRPNSAHDDEGEEDCEIEVEQHAVTGDDVSSLPRLLQRIQRRTNLLRWSEPEKRHGVQRVEARDERRQADRGRRGQQLRHRSRDEARKRSRERKEEDVSGDKVAGKHAHFGQLSGKGTVSDFSRSANSRPEWNVP